MSENEVDFHGMSLNEAVQKLDAIIGSLRLAGKSEDILLITGHGLIKKTFKEKLSDYEIEYREQIGNSGAIIASIE